jgi:small subunit ribosomal protein S16
VLTIRLSRVGKKNQPQYRLVLQEKVKSPKGKAIETLGYYHPLQKTFECDVSLVEKYIKEGAKPSSTVAHLLQKKGMKGMERYID